MQLPRLASSLRQWYYPPSLSIWGLKLRGRKGQDCWILAVAIVQIPEFRVVVSGAGTRGPPHTDVKDQCFLVFGVRFQVWCLGN